MSRRIGRPGRRVSVVAGGLVVLALLLIGGTRADPSIGGTGTPATPNWYDEFDGSAGSAPSAANWTHEVGAGGWGNNELQTYTDDTANASLDGDGHLVIAARRSAEAAGGYTSARLTTHGLQSYTYGVLQARIKLPSGTGLLPAFWLLGSDLPTVGYPASGEIDVVEAPNSAATTFHTVHGPESSDRAAYALSTAATHSKPLSDDFHTYTLIRSPGALTVEIDGERVTGLSRSDLSAGQQWVFDKPFDLVLSLAVGGNWPGSPTAATVFPAQLEVDWIRLWTS